MVRCMRVLVAALVGVIGTGCGGGASCDLPSQWSVANSGGLCQVNFFTSPEHAVYCSGASGNWDCACGPAAENPMTFTSADFCDLEGEERACQAVEECGFQL
jgi:hypothetical protein